MYEVKVEQIGDCQLYLADCRDVLPTLGKVDAVVTDPPWDAAKGIPGSDNPRGLFADVAELVAPICNRAAIQLGCDSDPAFLAPMANRLPFLRVCWLEYVCPSYKGRLLHTGDVAYVYGIWPSTEVATVFPGRSISSKSDREFIRGPKPKGKEKGGFRLLAHPMPRRLQHVVWLTKWFSEPQGLVLDPFLGSGTTGVACALLGKPFIGIEVHEPFFNLACERISRAVAQGRLFDEPKQKQEQVALL